ncbi:MAG TPA: PorT family protein [Chitinophagaceae bacterium]|nr:PorT family protein [Chitinophagaceae bacterium]
MKKVSMLVFAVLVLSASHTRAQGFHLGIKGGTNLSEINSRSFNNGFQWGFSAGAFTELNFTSKWGLQPELLFSQTNTQTANNFNDIYLNGINSQNVSLNYMNIPVLLSWKPIPLLSIQLGPQFGILMNTSETITTNGSNAFKSGDFSVVGGAQVNLGGFIAGARYVSGVTDINNVTSADTWKNESFQLYIGLRIF